MGKKPLRRKVRTQEHVLADLAVNYVERRILQRGCSVERIERDYGIDLVMFTYSDAGEIENGHIALQVKGTNHLKLSGDGGAVTWRVDYRDVRAWTGEPLPVILVVYDRPREEAFWLYIQRYAETAHLPVDDGPGETTTVHIPITNVLDETAIDTFRGFRDSILRRIEGVISHGP